LTKETKSLAAFSPHERVQAHDHLIFVGIVESVKDLQKIHGLTPAKDQIFKLDSPRTQHCLIGAVVSNTCPLVDKTIHEGRFRTVYNAVVIAVARNGERLRKKVGDIILHPGDTLLLKTSPSFEAQLRNSRDYFLVSQVENSNPPCHIRTWVALALLTGMILVVTFGWLSMLNAALLAVGLMLLTSCCSWSTAKFIHLNLMPFAMVIMVAALGGFATPLG
jgi:di/tricarboxylate transporter